MSQSLTKLESDIYRKLSILKACTASEHGESRLTAQRNLQIERRPLPKFSGARRNYPSFKQDWKATVTDPGTFDPEHELREIRERVPKEVQPDMKSLKSMDEVWDFLNKEYGLAFELTRELLSSLTNFKYSKEARGNYQKFLELYRRWTTVFVDLKV